MYEEWRHVSMRFADWIFYTLGFEDPVDYSRYFKRIIYLQEKGLKLMANNFDRLNAAVQAVSDNVADVAEAIRNPAVDNNDQEVIDDLAGRLEAAAESLDLLVDEENAEDAGPQPAPEPEPEEPPVE